MILFNLIFSKNISELSSTFNENFYHLEQSSNISSSFIKKSHSIAYILKETEILSGPKQKIAKQSFIKPKIWQKIFNYSWQQKVFLSLPSKISDKYNTELSYLNIRSNQSNYKYLVSQFSRSLFNGSIKSSLDNDVKPFVGLFSNLEYVWAKNLRLKQLSLSQFFQKNQSQNHTKKARYMFHKVLNLDHLPLFTVSNHLGQMIISEPPEELLSHKYIPDYKSNELSNQHLYQGWFFTNYEDAIEYKQYVSQYYNVKDDKLKIFTCNLPIFYNLISQFDQKICFRLIPDLKEIGQLIRNYRFYNHVSFHKNQKYSRTYFQGQPLYMFKEMGSYLYQPLSKNKQVQNYNLVFTNYDTACYTWNKLKKKAMSSDKSIKPKLIVYNLEYFIKDQLNNLNVQKYPFLVVPSQDSYQFTKNYQLRKNTERLYDTAIAYVSSIQLWSKRIFWSLTSKQP